MKTLENVFEVVDLCNLRPRVGAYQRSIKLYLHYDLCKQTESEKSYNDGVITL